MPVVDYYRAKGKVVEVGHSSKRIGALNTSTFLRVARCSC